MRSWVTLAIAGLLAAHAVAVGAQSPGLTKSQAIRAIAARLDKLEARDNQAPAFGAVVTLKAGPRTGYVVEEDRVLEASDRYTIVQRTSSGPGAPTYLAYWNGLLQLGLPGYLQWSADPSFPTKLNDRLSYYAGTAHHLYVSEQAETYPGFEWLPGPYLLIRRAGTDELFAVWSSKLNWPVWTQALEVRGAVIDGKPIGQSSGAVVKDINGEDFAREQAKRSEARKEVEARFKAVREAKGAFRPRQPDLLPRYKAGPASDPEERIAESLSQLLPDGATQVAALDVRLTAPAIWTVSAGRRKVHIIGVPWSLFGEDDWSKRRLMVRMKASKGLIIPPVFRTAPAPDGLGADQLEQGAAPIPADLLLRLTAAASELGLPPERYASRSPLIAGQLLLTDYRRQAGLVTEKATVDIVKLAREADVPVRNAGVVSGQMLQLGFGVGPDAGLVCLLAALEEVELGQGAFTDAIEGWKAGRVRQALQAPRGLEKCGYVFPFQAEIRKSAIEVQVEAIREALRPTRIVYQPGRRIGIPEENTETVAVVYLRALLTEDGVLAQLQARGLKIEAPVD